MDEQLIGTVVGIAVIAIGAYLGLAYGRDWWPFPSIKINIEPPDQEPVQKRPVPCKQHKPHLIIIMEGDGRMRIAANKPTEEILAESLLKESEEMYQKYGRPGTA